MKSIGVVGNTDPSRARLGEIGAILFRRKWQILVTFVVTVALVAAAAFTTPREYTARMKILVKNERASMVVSTGISAQTSPPGEVSETEINTEIELLNSNDLMRQVVTASGLDKVESIQGRHKAQNRQSELEDAVNRLRQGLKVSPVRKAAIIQIDYTARDSRQAVSVLRQLASSYLEAHLRVHGTPGTYEFFLNQARLYRSELRNAEAELTRFLMKNDIVIYAQQKEEILRRESEINSMQLANDAAIRERARTIAEARSQAAALEPRVMTQNRTLSNQTYVERMSTMLVELQNRRTQLLSKFRSDDRLVQEVSQEIADTQAALDKSKSLTGSDQVTDINPVRQALEVEIAKEQNEYAGLNARQQALVQQAATYRRQVNMLANATTEYEDLIRTEKEAEENYLLYTRKTEEARIADSLDQQKISNVAIAENPVEPLVPSKPNTPRNLALGTLLGFCLSVGIAFIAEYLAHPFPDVMTDSHIGRGHALESQLGLEYVQQASDLEALTGLPVLAITNRTEERRSFKRR